jgi:hypothetical protein
MLTSSDQCSPLPQNRIGSRTITKDEKSLSTGQQFQLCASKSSGVHCWRNKIFCPAGAAKYGRGKLLGHSDLYAAALFYTLTMSR